MMPLEKSGRYNVCSSHVRQNGTTEGETVFDVAIGIDGSIFLAGDTVGSWSGVNAGDLDFLVVKLDDDGKEMWRWQVRLKTCLYANRITRFLITSDK